MGGKKTVEKSREWEKERRDKLNVGFNDLCKLLPDHDPSISLSKMDILRRAAEYIRTLQDQNEEIIKSGDNNVLNCIKIMIAWVGNEAERLKKRVAYLLLKTKELVTALKAAGVPIPNNNKKKKKSKAQKVANGKDQNHVPVPPGVSNVGQVPCAVVLGNAGKPIASIALTTPPGKKVKCGCDKAAKKNPLSELNCASTAAATSSHQVTCNVTVVPNQAGPTILGTPVQANIHTLAPSLGPGTLIFRDGRVVTLPPAPVIPQILVKPQPTLIVMQRAPAVPQKRDKVPLIAPKRREITQTTYANKAPIPAIKTFRLESYPRPYKPKGKKKTEDNPSNKTTETSSHKKISDSLPGKENPSDISAQTKSLVTKNLKRRGDPVVRKSKISKPASHSQKSETPKEQDPPKTCQPKGEAKTLGKVSEEPNPTIAESNTIETCTRQSNKDQVSDECSTIQKEGTNLSNEPLSSVLELNISALQPIQDSLSNSNKDVTTDCPKEDEGGEMSGSKSVVVANTHEKIVRENAVTNSEEINNVNNSFAGVECSNDKEDDQLTRTSGRYTDTDSSHLSTKCSITENNKESLFVANTSETIANENMVVDNEIVSETVLNPIETDKELQDKSCVSSDHVSSTKYNDVTKNDSRESLMQHSNSNYQENVPKHEHLMTEGQFQNSNQSCYISASIENGSAPKTPLVPDAASIACSVSGSPCYIPPSSGSGSTFKTSLNAIASIASSVSSNPCYFPTSSGTESSLKTSLVCSVGNTASLVPRDTSYVPASSGGGSTTKTKSTDSPSIACSMSISAKPLLNMPTTSSYMQSHMSPAVSLSNDEEMPMSSFSSTSALQSSYVKQPVSSSSVSCHSLMPVTSWPNKISSTRYFSGQSSLPATSFFNNSAVPDRLQGHSTMAFPSHTTPSCPPNSSSMELATCSVPQIITTTASYSYAPTSIDVTPSWSSSMAVCPSLSNRKIPFEDGLNNQKTKPDADSSSQPKDSTNTAAARKLPPKSAESDSSVCPAVNILEINNKSVIYQSGGQHVPGSGKNVENSQCTKTSNMRSEAVTNIEGSQKRYSEHLGRTSTLPEHVTQTAKSAHSNINTTNFASMSTSLASNSQVYSFGLPVVSTEPARAESFFNYENPIATLPSDPFFCNFKPSEMPVSCAANSGFGYSTYTTQAPPVRSVARQLFPSDPLCSISNSYNLDTNLPPLNSTTAGQMFQFSSYSNTNSFRDPLLFNDFLPTPTKNTSVVECAPDKEPSLNNTHTFHDFIHPNTSSFSNISCSFSVGQIPSTSSTYVTSDFSRISSDQSNRKQYQTTDQSMFRTKQIPKSGADGNFSMNVITSGTDLKIQDHRNPSNPEYAKVEASQNFNFSYLNAPQSLAPQMGIDSFNFNMRDSVQHPPNIPSNSAVSQNLNSSNQAGKNIQKTSNQKSTLSKEFPGNVSGGNCSTRGVCDVPSNTFQNDSNNIHTNAPTKSTQGANTFRICGSSSQSNNQGVQTHQSYLYNPNSQQNLNKPHVPSSGSQIFSCSSQANQIHSTYFKYPKSGQDTPYGVPDNHMKISGGQQNPETGNCILTIHNRKNYHPGTSSHSVNFSASSMLSHSTPNRSIQGPMLGSYSSVPTTSQSIYSNPTTAANNQYPQDGDVPRNNNQNLFRISHMSTNSSGQSSQTQNQSNLCPSTNQRFSTVESHAQQNLEASQNGKPSNVGNQIESHTQLDQTNVHTFSDIGSSQTNQKTPQTDMMSNFSMSNLTGYSQSSLPTESHINVKRGPNQTYSQLLNTKQNTNANKTSQYSPRSSHNPVTAKQCEYPLGSVLTGLNDPVLNSSVVANQNQLATKTTANASTQKTTCNDKVIDKQYSTNTEGNSFKITESSTCNADYLQSKESDRNFIPIIEDVRLNSEFSNDLFSSLQVPTGGAHADSTSPTAAFLLAFPLVSTSKNADNPHESDPQENTSTPTTILQIGNIEPSNSEMFHPLEFGKDMEPSDYLGQAPDKCKRKDVAKQKKPNMFNSYSYPSVSGDYNVHYDQNWNDQTKIKADVRKRNEKQNKFCGTSNNEMCKDKKKKSKISVNWMAAPDVETYQKEQEASSYQATLSFPMDIDALPDLCTNKKTNAYSWSPSKSLLPLDPGLVIPSTLPTLVGDLALGTPTPSDHYKRCDNAKKQDKSPEKLNSQKSQSNFLSVSQLVDPKSKKKLPEKCKKGDKKKGTSCQKRKDPSGGLSEPCMYPDNFLPPLNWDKYRYRNNYSAEALIASQDINESVNFTYQQNPNYFVGTELNQEHHHQSQQYQNSFNFPQNQFPPPFVADEYQNTSFSLNNSQNPTSKRVGPVDKRCREESSRFLEGASTTYQGHPPYPPAPLPPSSLPHSSNFTSNTTTSVTNFNLSTIFPEINERTGSQGQAGPSQQQQQHQQQQNQQHGAQSHSHNVNTFQSSNQTNNYRAHNL